MPPCPYALPSSAFTLLLPHVPMPVRSPHVPVPLCPCMCSCARSAPLLIVLLCHVPIVHAMYQFYMPCTGSIYDMVGRGGTSSCFRGHAGIGPEGTPPPLTPIIVHQLEPHLVPPDVVLVP